MKNKRKEKLWDFLLHLGEPKNFRKATKKMERKRGDIYEVRLANGDRKFALIISADWRKNNKMLSTLVLSYENTHECCVPIVCHGQMYADCECISFLWENSIIGFVRIATEEEMRQIDEGIAYCLDLKLASQEADIIEVVETPDTAPPIPSDDFTALSVAETQIKIQSDTITTLQQENIVLKIKLDTMEKMYKDLLADVIQR